MTQFDFVVIAFVVGLAFWGFRQGALIGVSSLAGFVIGALIGMRLAGAVLPQGSESPYAPLFGLIGGIAIGAATSEVAMVIAYRVRSRFTSLTARRVDGAAGALLFTAFALGIVWIGAAALQQSRVASDLATAARRSTVVRQLNATLPPSGPVMGALARIDPFPSVRGPAAGVGEPNQAVVSDPEIAAAGRSVVRVVGSACGYGVEGSGWVAANDLVVTNAHVVAGEVDTSVQAGGQGASVRATVVWFDPVNDIALLYTPGLGLAPLPFEDGDTENVSGAVLGYPENGPFDMQAARIGKTDSVVARDIYDHGPVTRRMTAFRADVRHGNSGGPVVDERGVVRAVVFAKSLDRDGEGYGVPISVLNDALKRVNPTVAVSAGPCA